MHVFRTLTAILLLTLASTASLADDPTRQTVVPPGWQGAYDYGYAPAVRVGDMVIISGIPAAGAGSYEDKVRGMYERAKGLLEAAGATFQDVVEVSSFHAESKDSAQFQAEFQLYMPIHREFFGENRPAWTAVGTTTLLSPGAVVETRFLAIVGSGANNVVVQKVADGD